MEEFEAGCVQGVDAARELSTQVESRVARFALSMAVQSLHDAQGYAARARYIVENGEHAPSVVDVPASELAPACEPKKSGEG
jgi:hypothetical protein